MEALAQLQPGNKSSFPLSEQRFISCEGSRPATLAGSHTGARLITQFNGSLSVAEPSHHHRCTEIRLGTNRSDPGSAPCPRISPLSLLED
ncbi:hypothetical protein NQZ68_005748 [Dissostichus eleginoides]|nr:hypothetical protein NQZ68_005748 [Dissostichus eleginoides]